MTLTPVPSAKFAGAALAAAALILAALPATAQKADPLATSAAEKGAVVTASGLVYLATRVGQGASPTPADQVRVHYRGSFPDGKEFDSSYKRGQPAVFPLNRVIPCWTEGLQLMKVGGKAKLTCPAATAYGARGTPSGSVPPNAILHFEVELLGIAGL